MRVFNLGGDLRKQEGRNRESGTAKEEKPLKWCVVTSAAMDGQGWNLPGFCFIHLCTGLCININFSLGKIPMSGIAVSYVKAHI